MRIYDNPSHPQYGVVRRLWVILAQLGMLEHADSLLEQPWDLALAEMMNFSGMTEHMAQRTVLLAMLLAGSN